MEDCNYRQAILKQMKKLIHLIKLTGYLLAVDDEATPKQISDNKYRLMAVIRAEKILSNMSTITSVDQLEGIPGIGKGIKAKVSQIIETGELAELSDSSNLKFQQAHSLLSLMEITEIGPRLAKKLITKHKIRSYQQLLTAVKEKTIKLPDGVTTAILLHEKLVTRIPRTAIELVEEFIRDHLQDNFPEVSFTICGSYRRGKLYSSDIDVLFWRNDNTFSEDTLPALVKSFTEIGYLIGNLSGEKSARKYRGYGKLSGKVHRPHRIDLMVTQKKHLGTSLLYFTGPVGLNTWMRKKAQANNMVLNEYSLSFLDIKTGNQVNLVTISEEKVFQVLKIPYLSPEERETWWKHLS